MTESVTAEFNADDVLEYATDSILVTDCNLDTPGPKIIYVNQSFEKMTGWSRAEILGKSPRILQGEKTDHRIFDNMREVLAAGEIWQGQTINYRKNGSEFMMEWCISLVPERKGSFGQDGKANCCVAVQRDITKRVETENKLIQARQDTAEANRKRINLARYFSPQTAEHLSDHDNPLGQMRRQNVAVLFIDIQGSTTIAEKLDPERVVAILQSFYSRMAKVIFSYNGSIEHFAGDSLLAIFGMPEAGNKDAVNALKCSYDMTEELDRWNQKRIEQGRQKIVADISVHYGEVVLGDIGVRESMSFTVIGDTVNTTSRLQELCRKFDKRVLVSEDVLKQAETEGLKSWRDYYCHEGTHKVRGREEAISVYGGIDPD
ncbi:adenylate/guanylate cyclase domain-containing protein [Kiloniella spongiae]|uniref:adenylate/guanylate cyclase domain-containing protein n=1 Tax=Kiloniella spongiae TaxID=1489064 RepID=UPI00069BD42D|nr:adenylate/guanylate cyclase domain-containing protein [Kiloniella spongiae]